MPTVSDDKRPMTGTWYRSTIDPNVLGKVTRVPNQACLHAGCHPGRCAYGPTSLIEVTFTGGLVDRCTPREFADSWELS